MLAGLLITALAALPARAADSSATKDLLARSAAADAAGDVETAWTLALQAAQSDPEDQDARERAAEAALAARRYQDAVTQASAGLKLDEPTPALYQARSAAYQALGKLGPSLADAQAGLALNPDSAAGRLRLAQAAEASGQVVAALASYRRAAELDGELMPVYQQARRRLGGARPWWPWGAGFAVFGVLAALSMRRRGRSRRVRFGSVIHVPPAADEPAPGRVLGGRFIVGRALDRGASSQTFEGRDLEDRPVVIRRFRRAFKLSSAQAATQLRHQGLVALEAAFEDPTGGFAVSAAPAGKTLAETLDKAANRRLPAEQVVAGARALADGLDAAHAAGLRHGRIASSEIWLEENGWKLCGLGLPGTAPADNLPPEGDAGTDAADLYALAVCLYEALSGEKPFSGSEAALAKSEGRAASLAGRVGLPTGLDAFFARALQPDPSRRFRSASEMLLALRSLVAPAVH